MQYALKSVTRTEAIQRLKIVPPVEALVFKNYIPIQVFHKRGNSGLKNVIIKDLDTTVREKM